jgi:hypothetical protein
VENLYKISIAVITYCTVSRVVASQGSKYKNKLACHFIILLGAIISYGLPSVKFGLQFGHNWQAAISSQASVHEGELNTFFVIPNVPNIFWNSKIIFPLLIVAVSLTEICKPLDIRASVCKIRKQ